jgi:hypothetical protein
MYDGVPTTIPVVRLESLLRRASPKSRILTWSPSPAFCDSTMFAGLMSRWMMPCSCACASPDSSWRTISVARGGGSGADFAITSLRF